MTDTGYVQPIDVRRIDAIRTNFNPCRQRTLSRAQATVLDVAETIGVGDLAAIAAASEVDGEIKGCEVGYGHWEPADDAGWKRFGCAGDLVDERDARTVRITCRQGRKAAWVELTYDDAADADRVLAAVGARADAWERFDEQLAAAF